MHLHIVRPSAAPDRYHVCLIEFSKNSDRNSDWHKTKLRLSNESINYFFSILYRTQNTYLLKPSAIDSESIKTLSVLESGFKREW